PWVSGSATEPLVAASQRTQGQFCNQDRARFIQTFNDGRISIDHLLLKPASSPRGRIMFNGEQVLGTPRNTVKRSAVTSRGDFAVDLFCLCHSALIRKRDEKMKLRIKAFQASQIHLREVDCLDFLP